MGTNVPTTERRFFPRTMTSNAQEADVYTKLIPTLVEKGILKNGSFTGFMQWAISEAADLVGVEVADRESSAVGRPRKERV